MSLGTALDRLAAIIVGRDASWRRSKQRVSSLADPQRLLAGIDRTFWLGATPQSGPDAVTGSPATYEVQVTIEWARTWHKGDALDRDYFGLIKSMEAEIQPILDTLAYQPNWDRVSTGIILVTPFETAIGADADPEDRVLLFESTSTMRYRQTSGHQEVA